MFNTKFFGAWIQAPQWGASPETFEYWRLELESAWLKAFKDSGTEAIYSLIHDWELDARLHASLHNPAAVPARSVVLYSSEKESSRIFQLANVITKCIANRGNLNKPGSSVEKNAQISLVLSHYELRPEQWTLDNSRIVLVRLTL